MTEKRKKTGGRQKGTENKVNSGIKHLAGLHTKEAIDKLVRIIRKSKNEANVLEAIDQLLNRAHGKPTQAIGVDPDLPGALTISWLPTQGPKKNDKKK